jgi:hypothetical protein
MNRDYNPFANLDLHIPVPYREEIKKFTTSQGGDGDTSVDTTPFVRYVDLWATAVAVGAQEKAFVSDYEKHRFITGAVLQGDLSRIEFLQLVAIGHTKDPYVINDSRQVIDIADSYAAGGMPIVMQWLDGGSQSATVSLTKHFMTFLNDIPQSEPT